MPVPDPPSKKSFTQLLTAVQGGDPNALDQAFVCVYNELMRLAGVVSKRRASATLNTTALVHEVYAKLNAGGVLPAKNRLHFMRIAAHAMRQVLVDAAEKKCAAKRGGGQADITIDEAIHKQTVEASEFIVLHDALQRLERMDSRQAQIVECRFFAGLTIPETANALDISVATVNREWKMARAWLSKELRNAG